jgi:hypothetical protein
VAAPTGRFSVAFGNAALDWDAAWTRIDDVPSRLVSSTIDRGRQYELDRTDAARATVQINDTDGTLDPTNPAGPYYGLIEPLRQAVICARNPVADEWQQRFRGWITDWNYSFDPSQQVNRLQLELTDVFEILGAAEMIPGADFDIPGGHYGLLPPPESAGQIVYGEQTVQERIQAILADAGVPAGFAVVFSGNVRVRQTVYSAAETPLVAIQEAADAEFPGVSNVYTDRLGRLVFHGRLAKFDPAGVAAGASPGAWDWHHWHAGDGAAVHADLGAVAQLRRFGFNQGVSKIINSALATPLNIADEDTPGQLVQDFTSIGRYGSRSWSAPNLLTKEGLLDSSTALEETRRFAQYYVDNYAQPRNRADQVGFRSIRPGAPGASITWQLLTRVDISDRIDLTVTSPGGGGFAAEPFYVEGVHETSRPLNPDHDDVTVTLDLSPAAYFDTNPFPTA